jgi:hypothetical protein
MGASGACSFLSPISPSRLCCGCLKGANIGVISVSGEGAPAGLRCKDRQGESKPLAAGLGAAYSALEGRGFGQVGRRWAWLRPYDPHNAATPRSVKAPGGYVVGRGEGGRGDPEGAVHGAR